jgi:hypothetical protein
MKQTFVKFAQKKFPQNYKNSKEETEGDDQYGLSECRIFDRSQFCNVMHGSAVVARQNKPASAGRAALRTPEKLLLSSA